MTGPAPADNPAPEDRPLPSSTARRSTPRPVSRRRDNPPPKTGPEEKDVLLGFLDYLRSSIAAKVRGAPEPAARTPGVASGTNLLGLITHLTHVERYTFLGETVTDWPATFHPAPDQTAHDVLTAYRDAIDRANGFLASCSDLTDATRPTGTRKNPPSVRWALVHMIEETGRHAGHADILRELIDGNTGR